MRLIEHQNSASSKITVTNTATLLFSLMDTAGSVTNSQKYFTDLFASGILITPEDGDIRVMVGTTPTASLGMLLTEGSKYYLPQIDLTRLKLIRTSANVLCSIDLFKADIDDVLVASGGGIDPVGLKNISGTQIDPATAQRQDTNTATIQDLYNQLCLTLDRLGYGLILGSDGSLKIFSVGTVTTVSTVTSITNYGTSAVLQTVTTLNNLGTTSSSRVVETLVDTAYNTGILANLVIT